MTRVGQQRRLIAWNHYTTATSECLLAATTAIPPPAKPPSAAVLDDAPNLGVAHPARGRLRSFCGPFRPPPRSLCGPNPPERPRIPANTASATLSIFATFRCYSRVFAVLEDNRGERIRTGDLADPSPASLTKFVVKTPANRLLGDQPAVYLP